ncbi:hypothetical protein [Thiomicrorhabdus sp.]|uniref:hypothetical protein n=1 Tax=Thiomicrorhabdus sp. TaxID=2039724 RepID=UPI003567F5B5
MKILDQKLQLSAQHYARNESREQRVHDTYVDGMLNTRTTETSSSKSESLSIIELRNRQSTETDGHAPKSESNLHRQTNNTHELIDNRHSLKTEQFRAMPQPRPLTEPFTGQAAARGSQKVDNLPELPQNLIRMIEAIESLMEKMTGKSYHLKIFGYESREATTSSTQSEGSEGSPETSDRLMHFPTLNFPDIGGFQRPNNQASMQGERWQLQSSYFELEQTDFRAQGNVTTANGEQIVFDLNMQMSRSFSSQVSAEREKGFVLKDPLTVNFGGTPATLSMEKVQFDIDADGQLDDISFVQPGSGFLALDKNQDGVVNDGTELFGTQSGNGFADLSAYDEDGNGWIDENDSVFSKLQIWHKDANGLDQMQGLLELNIGAISLQNIDTPFSYKDQNNQLQGQAVSSGVFLYEDGRGAGSVQQIDLAV